MTYALLFVLWSLVPDGCWQYLPATSALCKAVELPGPTKCWELTYDQAATTPQPVVAVPRDCATPDPSPPDWSGFTWAQ